jgi:hypothetical protein
VNPAAQISEHVTDFSQPLTIVGEHQGLGPRTMLCFNKHNGLCVAECEVVYQM